ncbi:MAG: immunoglobulin-like domain-containing protein [Huintestinicola sp.]
MRYSIKALAISAAFAALLSFTACGDTGNLNQNISDNEAISVSTDETSESISDVTAECDTPAFEAVNEPHFDIASEEWGISMSAENITPTGLTAVFTRNGGDPVGEYMTGTSYFLEEYFDGEWKPRQYLPQEYEICWDSVGYIIADGSESRFDINWEQLYGSLENGKYRIGKDVQTGSGATLTERNYYAYFDICE